MRAFRSRPIRRPRRQSVRTPRQWRDHPEGGSRIGTPPARDAQYRATLPEPTADYAYLLGLYRYACISRSGDPAKRIWVLRIACADAWPGLVEDCKSAIKASPENKVGIEKKAGCFSVQAYSRHWPCLFPQHGAAGNTTEDRARRLAASHRRRYPGRLARGLFHSDGCRFVNRVRRRISRRRSLVRYPRYMFTNQSDDILAIAVDALDRLGVSWRFSRRNDISRGPAATRWRASMSSSGPNTDQRLAPASRPS